MAENKTETFDFLTENESRSAWHALVEQFGLERCSVKRIDVENGCFYRITVK